MAVEDKENIKDSITPDFLREATGIGEDEEQAMEREAYNGAAEGIGESLRAGEESGAQAPRTKADESESSKLNTGKPDDNDDEGWYKKGDKKGSAKRLFTRRRVIALGAISAIGGSGVAILFLIFPALRLENYMQRINQRAFALAASGVESRTQHLFDRYMISHVINLQNCTAVRSIDCKADYGASGLAGGLFTTWRDARVEAKIFDRLGFTVESTQNPNRAAGVHKFTLRDRRGASIEFSGIDDWNRFKSGTNTLGSRELGREIRLALKQETRWYELMQRRSIRKYLSRKHDISLWCFFACKSRDNVELKLADAKTRYKYRFVERFVYPFSGKYGFIMDCIISGTPGSGKCSSGELRERGVDRDRVPDETVDKILTDFKDNPDLRLSQVVIRNLLEKVMSQASAKTVVSAIPVAGQIYFGLVVIDMFDRLDGFIDNNGLSKYAAEINASQYLEYYSGMRSFNDEMKSGDTAFDEVGAVMTDFDGAEQSRVYKSYNNSLNTSASLLGQKAYAQAASDSDYKCDNGQPIPEGEYVCNEKKLTRTYAVEDWRDNRVIDGIVGILNNYDCVSPEFGGHCPPGASPRSYIRPVLGGIEKISNSVFGTLADGAMAAIRALPEVGDVVKFVEQKSQELMESFFGRVFPLPVDVDSPGREKYDGLEAGADVAASQFGQGGYTDSGDSYGLGAPAISDTESTKVLQEYFAQQDYEFKNSSWFARLTDTNQPRSLASQLILKTPSGTDRVPSNIASGFMNLFRNLANTLSLIFSSNAGAQSGAEQQLAINAFGVTRYGYGVDDPVFTRDPAELTEATCEQYKQQRLQSVTENELTGFEEYGVTDPCLLEEVVVEAAGAYFRND